MLSCQRIKTWARMVLQCVGVGVGVGVLKRAPERLTICATWPERLFQKLFLFLALYLMLNESSCSPKVVLRNKLVQQQEADQPSAEDIQERHLQRGRGGESSVCSCTPIQSSTRASLGHAWCTQGND